MRDNKWLQDKLFELWEGSFVDVPRKNTVLIKFSKRSYRQLGCITWVNNKTRGIKPLLASSNEVIEDDKRISLINVTGYFKDEEIPEVVVLGTIAHEMCHYAHGFNSPLNQIYDHPHKGGVIKKELQARGLGELYKRANAWLKSDWPEYLKRQKK